MVEVKGGGQHWTHEGRDMLQYPGDSRQRGTRRVNDVYSGEQVVPPGILGVVDRRRKNMHLMTTLDKRLGQRQHASQQGALGPYAKRR
jgi:hypothetical protein